MTQINKVSNEKIKKANQEHVLVMSSSCTLHTNFDTPRQGTPQNIVPSHARNKLKKPNPKKNLNLVLFILILRIFMHPIESAKPWPKLKTTTDK